MSSKDLCLSWLEWFKSFIEEHDSYHSSFVLATTNKTFEYAFYNMNTSLGTTEVIFDSRFIFTYKGDKERVVQIPYLKLRWVVGHEQNMYKEILAKLTQAMIYGKEFINMANILKGKAVINWQEKVEDQYTLEDLLKKTIR